MRPFERDPNFSRDTAGSVKSFANRFELLKSGADRPGDGVVHDLRRVPKGIRRLATANRRRKEKGSQEELVHGTKLNVRRRPFKPMRWILPYGEKRR